LSNTPESALPYLITGHQEATHELWPKLFTDYEPYISALVFDEARKGDPVQAEKRLSAIEPKKSIYRRVRSVTQREII